jgi:hypothetical protein
MSVLNGSIRDVVAGDALDVRRTVTDIPAGQTLAKAWLTFKSDLAAADNSLLQKVIVPGAVVGQGQITDTGADGTGEVLFQLSNAETLALPIGVRTAYDIKVLTSAGKIYTPEQGVWLSVPRVTQAIA